MHQFIQDIIHMTEMEFFLKYWWVELMAFIITLGVSLFIFRRGNKCK